jgi:hypothetical protein
VKEFVLGSVATLAAIVVGVFLVSHFGLYPIGADNPPGTLERSLAGRAMNVYVVAASRRVGIRWCRPPLA